MSTGIQAFVGTPDKSQTLNMYRSDYMTDTITIDDTDVSVIVPIYRVESHGMLEFKGAAKFWYGPNRLPLRMELTGKGFAEGDPLRIDLQVQLQSVDPS